MGAHISQLCRTLFCQLRRIGKIRSFLSTDAANKLAVSFILSRLDYCNSLLAGLPENKLSKHQASRLTLTSRIFSFEAGLPLDTATSFKAKFSFICIILLCYMFVPSTDEDQLIESLFL